MVTQNTPQRADDLIGQRKLRLEKLAELQKRGYSCFPAKAVKEHSNATIREKFYDFENKKVTLAGRLMSLREHGKLMFADLVDESGKLQLFIKQDAVVGNKKEQMLGWEDLKLLDVGDFVQATGIVVKTARGEISLQAEGIRLLTKSIRPIPNTLDDKEQQFRRRYLDLLIHPEKKELFKRKAHFWKVSRDFMFKNGFIEVETPVLEHVTGGADARPFVTHHNDLDQDFYMRISTELYQKRLIGAGFEKIFTLAPNFRNEGTSDEHLQEYYQLEWYWAYANYEDNMKLVQNCSVTQRKKYMEKQNSLHTVILST
ncbi:MAG: amino acid--tRNA ligase-related protein [Patescibacteria group bacterium]